MGFYQNQVIKESKMSVDNRFKPLLKTYIIISHQYLVVFSSQISSNSELNLGVFTEKNKRLPAVISLSVPLTSSGDLS